MADHENGPDTPKSKREVVAEGILDVLNAGASFDPVAVIERSDVAVRQQLGSLIRTHGMPTVSAKQIKDVFSEVAKRVSRD